jgi:hypothetical protein
MGNCQTNSLAFASPLQMPVPHSDCAFINRFPYTSADQSPHGLAPSSCQYTEADCSLLTTRDPSTNCSSKQETNLPGSLSLPLSLDNRSFPPLPRPSLL